MFRAYKTELDPNNEQRTGLLRHAGVARFVYNWALADRIARYEAGQSTNMYEQRHRFTTIKNAEYPWISECAYALIDSSFANLDIAYKNFFRRVKLGAKPGFPKFKSRKRGIGSFTLRGSIHAESGRIKLPVIGWLRLKENGYLPCTDVKIMSATISERAGHWFVSLQVEEPDKEITPATGIPIGVDLGIKSLAVCSNGKMFDNPKALARYERRLRHAQRKLSRRQKGSQNRKKAQREVARLHAKVANVRSHTIHEVTSYLTAKIKPSVIMLEDLNVSGMVKNHHLARSVSDASFAEMRRQITYKAAWNGVQVVFADRFFASSKTCSQCGCKKDVLPLSVRTFVCDDCGMVMDRDLNAARNLAALAGKLSVAACGGESSMDSSRCSPVKQEPSS